MSVLIVIMIQEFKVTNFLSFRDEATLSFEASKEDNNDNRHVVKVGDGVRLLRLAVIYGANASGKSNLLQGLEGIREFWFGRKSDMDESTGFTPFLLDSETPNKPSRFELKFWVNDTKYWYQLEVDSKQVYSEKLYYYKSKQPTLLFTRNLESGQSVIKFNQQAMKVSNAVVEEVMLRCLPNMSFFAARNRVNCSLPEIDAARDWMKSGLLPIIEPNSRMFEYAGDQMLKDVELKKYILGFLKRADSNITGINLRSESVPIPNFIKQAIAEDNDVPESAKDKLLAEDTFNRTDATFEHTVSNERGLEIYKLPSHLQSSGTQRVLGLEAAIYEAVRDGDFVFADEIESSLHPDLLELVLKDFLKKKGRSQLIFSTHYDPLLNTIDKGLLRKDSVLFTEKDENGNTRLYPLTEFRRLNKISSFQRSYRSGLFGATPQINQDTI